MFLIYLPFRKKIILIYTSLTVDCLCCIAFSCFFYVMKLYTCAYCHALFVPPLYCFCRARSTVLFVPELFVVVVVVAIENPGKFYGQRFISEVIRSHSV